MSDNPNWKETQAKLLEDIEAFARSEPNLKAAESPKAQRMAPAVPAPAPAPAPAPRPATPAQTVSAAAAASAPVPAAPPPGGSLLERLKREAMAKQMSESQRFSLEGQKKRFVSDALNATFQYLRELCDQLNIIKPAYPMSYNLLGIANLEGMSWQEGRADFRLLPGANDEKFIEQVTLRLRLASGQQLRVERENPAHEAFRKALMEANITFKEEEFRNQKAHVERAAYTFPVEVKAGLVFAADYQAGDIRLLVKNLRRFGSAEYRLPCEALDQSAFEELAHLILGEDSRIDKMFRRVA